jgi:hypothetical protein
MSFMCTSSTGKGEGVGKGNTDNSVKNIVFRNTEISHPFNHTVPQQNVARICCINRFTSLCKNFFNLLEFLAEAF